MESITSNDLRRRGSEVLDRVLTGEGFYVTRNGRPAGVLLPVFRFEELTAVKVGTIAHTLKVSVPTVARLVHDMIEAKGGPAGIVLKTADTSKDVLLHVEAANRIVNQIIGEHPAEAADA